MRGTKKTFVAAVVSFVVAALLEGACASSGVCKNPSDYRPSNTLVSPFGVVTCESTVQFQQINLTQVFNSSWTCEGKSQDVKSIVFGIA